MEFRRLLENLIEFYDDVRSFHRIFKGVSVDSIRLPGVSGSFKETYRERVSSFRWFHRD